MSGHSSYVADPGPRPGTRRSAPQQLPDSQFFGKKHALVSSAKMSFWSKRVVHSKPIRRELHHNLGGLRVQLGSKVGHLAVDLRLGLLRDRDDRLVDFAL